LIKVILYDKITKLLNKGMILLNQNIKKYFTVSLMSLVVLSLFYVINSKPVLAESSVIYTVYSEKLDVPTDKIWRIMFREEMDISKSNLSKYIYIATDKNEKHKVKEVKVKGNTVSSPGYSILLYPPPKGWVSGKVYYLFINKNIKKINGETYLSKTVRMKFTIINE